MVNNDCRTSGIIIGEQTAQAVKGREHHRRCIGTYDDPHSPIGWV